MLERRTTFRPAYDLTRSDPSRNYGIHNMVIEFAVVGPKGAVNCTMSTGWHLPAVQERLRGREDRYPRIMPWITDIGYHSKKPLYEWHTPDSCRKDCKLTGGDCYYDGTSLWGDEEWKKGFLNEGSEWLFARLEEYYYHRFEDGPPPNLNFKPVPHPDEET